MTYIIRVRRQADPDTEPYWQEFDYEGQKENSVAYVLNAINEREQILDRTGKKADPVSWERSCMIRKCGACAMRINGIPRLACSTFLKSLKETTVILEPLSKFPVVRDLTVDRSVLFESLKKMNLWLESKPYLTKFTHQARYQSARCLMCGCCLEVCPNFSVSGSFAGAAVPVNAFRVLNEELDRAHEKQIAERYRKIFFAGCGQSLACHNICPAGIPVEELMVRSNAAAVWGTR